jgi:hypothetical protein
VSTFVDLGIPRHTELGNGPTIKLTEKERLLVKRRGSKQTQKKPKPQSRRHEELTQRNTEK